MAKEKSKYEKYVIRSKGEKEPICGLRYDAKGEQILIGGPKSKMDKVWDILKMLDSKEYAEAIPEDDKNYIIDGSRYRIKMHTTQEHWCDFIRRLGRLFELQPVKKFGRFMG